MGCNNSKLVNQQATTSPPQRKTQDTNGTARIKSAQKTEQSHKDQPHPKEEPSSESLPKEETPTETQKDGGETAPKVDEPVPTSESGQTVKEAQTRKEDEEKPTEETKEETKKSQPLTEEQKREFHEWAEREKQRADILAAEIMAMMKKAEANQVILQALYGQVNMKCPTDAKIVRIFTSSTFTDTKQERNYLMKHGYPVIKSHCRRIGYEFQVVDMRWGVRDEATDDHMGTELCLKELKLCQQVSTGPNFVTLLSQKYGYTAFPRVIEATEFETLMQAIEDEETLNLFKKWYTRDDNAVPPEYILSPISKHLPAFIGQQGEEKKAAKQQWWMESDIMLVALEHSATKVYDADRARKFIMSVTETEVKYGLLDLKTSENTCLWLKRDIVDIDQQEKNYALSRFMECTGTEEKDNKAQSLLKDLKENRIQKRLSKNKILQYEVHWDPNGGINPEKEEHRLYLEKMCGDFTENMISMIDQAVQEKARKEDHLVDECLQHIRFCQLKCESFHGREETLQTIKDYVTTGKAVKAPLVIHGESGSGKTSIIAMAAKMMAVWRKDKPLILLRFLGTTQDSSSVLSLLYSMTSQLERCLKMPVSQPSDNLTAQRAKFWITVHKYQMKYPLIIMLDSLDQLDEKNDARKLLWMPATLAKGLIIVSTLEEPQYECFPALQEIVTEADNFVKVPKLSRENCSEILSSWFDMNKRCVTTTQMDMLLSTFDKCSIPLFLKLSFDEAVRWTSYMALDNLVLCETVRASIDHLFNRLEKHHGKMLFSRALAYLTTAKNGASEVELEDILSCDDDVLNDVYMYWTPPIRRLPPLLLVRIKNDLGQYLVERGADGLRVLYWYHRQFIEAAEAKYCSDEDNMKIIHQNLADFFGGEWANGKKKPYTNSEGQSIEEDRFVSSQPLLFGEGQYNFRHLNNLPFHSVKAGNADMVIQKCLTDLEFLKTKMEALDVISVLDDYKMANEAFPDNSLISSILGAMQLSQKGLRMDPAQIVPQMLQRLTVNQDTSDFIQQCRDYPHTYLEPNMPLLDLPGGQLLHNIATHNGDVDMIDMTSDGKMVLTVCQEKKELFLWNIETAKQIRAVQAPGQCTEAYFCLHNKCVAVEKDKFVQIEDIQTGSKKCSVPLYKSLFCVAGENKNIIVVCKKRSCMIHNIAEKGEIIATLELAEGAKGFGQLGTKAGSTNFVAMTDDDQYLINILDLKNHKLYPQFRGFPRFKDEDGDWVEHEVEAMAITPDETCLIYTTMFTSEVVFSDFHGTKLRSIPPNEDRSFTSMELSPDGSQLFLASNNIAYIYSTHTLQEVDMIEHVKSVKKVKMVNNKCIVTISDDSNLRIWDMTRQKLQKNDKPTFLKHTYIRTCMLLDNPRYLLIEGRIGKEDKHMTLIVYDIFKEEVVKELILRMSDKDQKMSVYGIYKTKTWHKVNMVIERKIYTLDLDTMTITMTTDGYSSRHFGAHQDGILYTANNEIVCLSKGAMNLKLCDQSTGKVNRVIKAGQEKKFETVVVNKGGTVACAKNEDEDMYLFNLVNGTFLYKIDKDKYRDAASYLFINNKGTLLLFSVNEPLPGAKDQKDEVEHVLIWDIMNEKEVGRMFDLEYEEKNRLKGTKDCKGQTAIYELFELDQDRAITVGMDEIIRVHDINTGKLLHRLEGHFSTPTLFIEKNSPYLLTQATMDEEGSMRLWDMKTYKCLATFTLEKDINKIAISPDGKFFTSTMSGASEEHLVQWRIHNGPYDSNVSEADYPQQLSSKVTGEDLVFSKVTPPLQQDPDDIDSDPDDYSKDNETDDEDDEDMNDNDEDKNEKDKDDNNAETAAKDETKPDNNVSANAAADDDDSIVDNDDGNDSLNDDDDLDDLDDDNINDSDISGEDNDNDGTKQGNEVQGNNGAQAEDNANNVDDDDLVNDDYDTDISGEDNNNDSTKQGNKLQGINGAQAEDSANNVDDDVDEGISGDENNSDNDDENKKNKGKVNETDDGW